MRGRLRPLVALAAALVMATLVTQALRAAESAGVVEEGAPVPSPSEPPNEYLLGPGDIIEISVFGVPDYQHSRRISESGFVELPLVGAVAVGGRSSSEAESHIESKLAAGLIKNPEVEIQVVEYRARTSFVLGQVRQPGQYQITRPTRLVDMIAMAGGLATEAGEEAIVHCSEDEASVLKHRLDPESIDESDPSVRRVSLTGLLEAGDSSANVPVRGGCVVQIPERDPHLYYVVGDVVIPGTFELDRHAEMRLTRALARAGGPTKTAKKKKVVLVRDPDGPNREEIPVNFAAIVKGEVPDLKIQENDVIFVPGNGFKSLGYGLMGAIPITVSRVPVR